ncbi:silencing group b protein [Nannochloropsis gaditana]|uniref:Silencing group b protein n=1 Tax=Nannochloropsis gaditana TaxID=72520 RepID=W7UA23_9STRA|nr:silencing group b protein [Nannochloropsis gaditana]
MLGPSLMRRELSANLLFLYLLRTSAAVVTPPERPAWARGYVAFHKDRSGMKASATASAAAGNAAHDQGHFFTRSSPFGRVDGSSAGRSSPSKRDPCGSNAGNHVSSLSKTSHSIRTSASAKASLYAGNTLEVAPPQVCIRTARREDIPAIEACNLKTLPENYPNAFYYNHLLQWPYLALVAERQTPARAGAYPGRKTGHVSSLAVLDDFRRLGIARELMEILHVQMKFRYGVDCSTLHVRCSNRGAQKLYLNSLGYRVVETVQKYYQDGADAYYMKLNFRPSADQHPDERWQEEGEEGREVQEALVGSNGRRGRVKGPGSGGSGVIGSGFSVREEETAPLTQDSRGYFHLSPGPSRRGGVEGGAAAMTPAFRPGGSGGRRGKLAGGRQSECLRGWNNRALIQAYPGSERPERESERFQGCQTEPPRTRRMGRGRRILQPALGRDGSGGRERGNFKRSTNARKDPLPCERRGTWDVECDGGHRQDGVVGVQ